MTDELLQIGEFAERVGLSQRTVRYYEEQGLVEPHKRTTGGFRLYTEWEIDRLLLIKQMKPLGFTLEDMSRLLAAREVAQADPGAAAAHETLAEYAAQAAERLLKLRRQLEQSEGLADQLRREAEAGSSSFTDA